MVKRTFFGGALILLEMDGNDFSNLVNSDAVKNTTYEKKKRRNLSQKFEMMTYVQKGVSQAKNL